ncbi:MAG: MBL fold metallo-hydrolase [Leptolinea sp.]
MIITPTIHQIRGMANQYLIIDHTELTLIDTGISSNTNTVIKFIKSLGFQTENLKRMLITHADGDHYGAVNSLREITGAKVFASRIEADAMKTGTSSRDIHPKGILAVLFKVIRLFSSTQPTSVESIIKSGEILPILGGLHVMSSNGHTPGHMSFYLPDERILFAGDSINSLHRKPVPNISITTADPEDAKISFENQMKLNPLVICCGHTYLDLR